MSDLISRSALLELFEEKMFNDKLMNPVIKMSDVIEIIEEQPVAYDKEKVIKELEDQKDKHTEGYNLSIYKEFPDIKERYEQIQLVLDKAIEKVKAGGINE